MNRDDVVALLPRLFRVAVLPGSPMDALLTIMATQQAPSEAVLLELERYFDIRRTPERFVPYLARWVDLGPLLDRLADDLGEQEYPAGVGRLRDLTARAAHLSRWGGTRPGLIEYLEVGTGVTGFSVEEHSGGRPFHLHVDAPAGAERYRPLVERIIEQEKPAYATYELAFATALPGGQ